MKIYEFKHACIAFCFTLTYLGFFVFGIIWLNNGYNVDKKFSVIREEINSVKEEHEFFVSITKLNIELMNDIIYNPEWRKEIMPSCFKGTQSTFSSKQSLK